MSDIDFASGIIRRALGQRLEKSRARRKLSVEEFSEACGITPTIYKLYVSGHAMIPTPILKVLQDRLGLSPSWILLGSDTVTSEHDVDGITQIATRLDQLSREEGVTLRASRRRLLLSHWIDLFCDGYPITDDRIRAEIVEHAQS